MGSARCLRLWCMGNAPVDGTECCEMRRQLVVSYDRRCVLIALA
jgi:hypothetical protein